MARSAGMDDLFGHVPQAGAPPVAGAAARRPEDDIVGGLMPVPPGGHTADTIRVQALMVLDIARAAATLPWDAKMVRRYTAMFPYWAEWLKNGEGDRLLYAFKAEMDRLAAPVDQVAPNWRAMWKLAA